MKLATYDDGSRDGALVVVSRDGTQAVYANRIATRLRDVLDDWNFLSPQLETLYAELSDGRARHAFALDPAQCLAPLPRPSACVAVQDGTPLALPGGFSRAPAAPANTQTATAHALLLADVPAGAPPAQALDGVRLWLTAQVWLDAHGQLQPFALPPPACTPLALTGDEAPLPTAQRGAIGEALSVICRHRPVACGTLALVLPGAGTPALLGE